MGFDELQGFCFGAPLAFNELFPLAQEYRQPHQHRVPRQVPPVLPPYGYKVEHVAPLSHAEEPEVRRYPRREADERYRPGSYIE